MARTRRLSKGDRVLVATGTHNRAITRQQATDVVEVLYAYPADSKGRMAGTVVEFTDGHEQVYNTSSDWIEA